METHSARLLARAEKLRHRGYIINGLFLSGRVCQMTGNWDGARDLYDRVLDLSPEWSLVLSWRALLEYETGETENAKVYMDRLVEVMNQNTQAPTDEYAIPACVIPTVALISGVAEYAKEADTALETVLDSASPSPYIALLANCGRALISVERGDAPTAVELYVLFRSYVGTMGFYMSIDRLLGMLASATGEHDGARDHLKNALEFYRKLDYRPELAWTCFDYATSLLDSDVPDVVSQAEKMLDDSVSISGELGMLPLLERAKARLDQIK